MNFVTHSISLLLLLSIPSLSYALRPLPSFSLASSLHQDKILFYGGRFFNGAINKLNNTDQLFILDLSKGWNVADPPFSSLVPSIANDASTKLTASWHYGEVVDDNFITFGGYIGSDTEPYANHFFQYDTARNTWNLPSPPTGDIPPLTRSGATDVGKDNYIYLYGGVQDINPQGTDLKDPVYDNVWAFDTKNWTWKNVTPQNPGPGQRQRHTFTRLLDGRFVVLGGRDANGVHYDFKDLWIYDPVAKSWENMKSQGGEQIMNRAGHTAVLSKRSLSSLFSFNHVSLLFFSISAEPDGNIIVYGGWTDKNELAQPFLALLNTSTSPFTWTIPTAQNSPARARAFHTCHLYRDTMIVAFGAIGVDRLRTFIPSDELVQLLNVNTWEWKTSYSPESQHSQPSALSNPTSGLNIGVVVGGTVGAVVVVVAAVAIALIIRKKRRQQQFDKERSEILSAPFDPVPALGSKHHRDNLLVYFDKPHEHSLDVPSTSPPPPPQHRNI
ncbi:uncharacterized protein VTP21DRAFT_9915 [Calcarisporiella thermophila]|uniref:uncharacterized protein n=1 Tax=Calcarisporiella thermophila TaxID=911321 RepID=UPI003743C59F